MANKLIDSYVSRMLRLTSAFETKANSIYVNTKDFHEKLLNEITKDLGDKLTKRKIDNLAKKVKESIEEYYNGQNTEIKSNFQTVATKEAAWTTLSLTSYAAGDVEFRGVNSQSIAEKANRVKFQGKTFKQWFNSQTKSEWMRISKELKNGYVQGKTTQEVVKEISKILGRSDHDIKTLTRSYLQHAAAQAREEIFQSTDYVIGYIWSATLDSRTTPAICGIRDGKRYDKKHKPIGHELPWAGGPGAIHFNCRSSFLPLLQDEEDLESQYTRPAVNAGPEYESGDNKTRTGKPRKPTKANIEKGIFKVKQVSGTTTYEQNLKTQKIDAITDVFYGDREAAKKFKTGEITLMDFAMSKKLSINEL